MTRALINGLCAMVAIGMCVCVIGAAASVACDIVMNSRLG